MIALCDITGLRLHRLCGVVLSRTNKGDLAGFGMGQKQLDSLTRSTYTARLEQPHVMILDKNAKRNVDAVPHYCTMHLPRGSLLELKAGIHVASIPICLSQMSLHLETYDLIRLLYEICSNYEIVEVPSDGLGETDESAQVIARGTVPLTTTKDLRTQLRRLTGFPGAAKVLAALDCVADNSCSPRETDLAMWAWCKSSLGGFGFRLATMNQPISIDGKERRCDLFFGRERVGVEYDSDAEHAGAQKNSADSARKKQIENKGYRVISITNGELKDFDQASDAMRLLGSYLGKRVRDPKPRTLRARKKLHDYITGEHRPLF